MVPPFVMLFVRLRSALTVVVYFTANFKGAADLRCLRAEQSGYLRRDRSGSKAHLGLDEARREFDREADAKSEAP